MSKGKTALYFLKQYNILIHSIDVNQRISIATLGNHSGHKEIFEKYLTYNLNQVAEVTCIDIVQDGTTVTDNQVLRFLDSL